MVKNLPVNAGDTEMHFRSLGWEDPLEEGMATHSSILAWKYPMERRVWPATVHRIAKSWTRLKQLSTHARTPVQVYQQDSMVRFYSLFPVPPHQGQMDILSICEMLLPGPVLRPLLNQAPLKCSYASSTALSPELSLHYSSIRI